MTSNKFPFHPEALEATSCMHWDMQMKKDYKKTMRKEEETDIRLSVFYFINLFYLEYFLLAFYNILVSYFFDSFESISTFFCQPWH